MKNHTIHYPSKGAWERQKRCLKLRKQGKSYAEIAKKVGYAHRMSALRAVRRAIALGDPEEMRTPQYLTLFEFGNLTECSAHQTLEAALKEAVRCEDQGGNPHVIYRLVCKNKDIRPRLKRQMNAEKSKRSKKKV